MHRCAAATLCRTAAASAACSATRSATEGQKLRRRNPYQVLRRASGPGIMVNQIAAQQEPRDRRYHWYRDSILPQHSPVPVLAVLVVRRQLLTEPCTHGDTLIIILFMSQRQCQRQWHCHCPDLTGAFGRRGLRWACMNSPITCAIWPPKKNAQRARCYKHGPQTHGCAVWLSAPKITR